MNSSIEATLISLLRGQLTVYTAEARPGEERGIRIKASYLSSGWSRTEPFRSGGLGLTIIIGAGDRRFAPRKLFRASIAENGEDLFELRRPCDDSLLNQTGIAHVQVEQLIASEAFRLPAQTSALVINREFHLETKLEVGEGSDEFHRIINREVDMEWERSGRKVILFKRLREKTSQNWLEKAWFIHPKIELPEWVLDASNLATAKIAAA